MLSQPLIHLRIVQAKTQLAQSKAVDAISRWRGKHTLSSSWKCRFQLQCRIIISVSFQTSFLTQNEKCSILRSNSCIAESTKMEKWRIPFASREFQFNHSVWQYCPVLWPPNGQCSINSASDEQAGQQNQKWGGGPRCMNYAYYITITLQYTVQQNNAVKIGLWLRYWTISYMVLAYLISEKVLNFLNNGRTHIHLCIHT